VNTQSDGVTLVTGATGFIGRKLTHRLINEGRAIRVLCRDLSRLDPIISSSPLAQIAVGDVSDRDVVERAVTGVSRVVHLAATTSGSWRDFEFGTVEGTRHVLEASANASVNRLVYVSSMSVYDYSKLPVGAAVDEDVPLETDLSSRNDYARAKSLAEDVARRFMQSGSVPVCIVRPGAVYGPGGRPFLFSTLKRIGPLHVLIGGGNRQIGMVYVENLVDALVELLTADGVVGRIYNVVDDEQPTERQIVETILRARGQSARTIGVPLLPFMMLAGVVQWIRDRRGAAGMNVVHGLRRVTREVRFDARRLKRDTHWSSRVGFADAMSVTFVRQ
jgi:nucleoside-diphosphate-sugar epimerase